MSTINVYAIISEYKAWKSSPAQTFSTDATDDTAIEDLLEAASRFIDSETGRTFYPRVETRYSSVPDADECNDPRELWLDDDLLAAITITNGDATTLASTEYHSLPKNGSPTYALRIRDTSSYVWECDTAGSTEYAISILGWWGYHEQYAQRAWSSGGTLGAAMSNDTGSATMTAGHSLSAGQVIKVDSEIMILSATGATSFTPVKRGDNGSTAAAHDNGATVYIWNVMDTVKQACLEIASNAYSRRYGQNLSGATVTTPAGMVIGPADVSETARKTMDGLKRRFF